MRADLLAGARPAGLWDAVAGAASDAVQIATGAAAGIALVLAVSAVSLLLRRRATRRAASRLAVGASRPLA